uniref:Uncharacterized protein n=1 Tax=Leersia perrieri TaxID=77586 RepID=A0A0D9W3N1_9ORYZ
MKKSVKLGARFLVNKPLDAVTTQNIWQHLDLKVLRMEKMKDVSPKIKKVAKNVCAMVPNQLPTYVQMQALTGDTKICDVYSEMRRSLQLGAVFDESNYPTDHPSGDKDKLAREDDIVGGYGFASEANATQFNDDHQVADPILSCNVPDASHEIMSKATSVDNQQATRGSDEPAAFSADEANVIIFSTGNLQINVDMACNADASQESIKKTTDDLNNLTESKASTLILVNYSDSESDVETEAYLRDSRNGSCIELRNGK